jgi:UDP-N-acetylglucosamine 1-carboxyvinyltransferase
MEKVRIRGGNSLKGTVHMSGAKNAALPVLIASLLTEEPCTFTRVPNLQDIRTTLKLLKHFGTDIDAKLHQNQVQLQAKNIQVLEAPYDLVRTMRASVIVLGPLLARFGKARVSLPGGCAIGARPINYHLSGFERLGASVELENGYVHVTAKKLHGNRVAFEFPSVGATQNLMMAAVLAQGETLLENCAREPEIVDLANVLKAMGAEIEGEGTEEIRIQGKDRLHGCQYEVMGDRIEAGTFLCAAFATQGEVQVEGILPEYLEAVIIKFEECGARVTRTPNGIYLSSRERPLATDIKTLPFPGFPTDMQAQFMAAMTIAHGTSLISETIFENRFMHVPELIRLGADISIRGNSAVVKGQEFLTGAPLMATDLRASASLIIGALCAKGESIINRIYHLDRGYENIEQKLQKLGADIERIPGSTQA